MTIKHNIASKKKKLKRLLFFNIKMMSDWINLSHSVI